MTPNILRANELYHDQEAESYDESQPYMRNGFAQRMFIDDIAAIMKTLAGVAGPLKVLDCGAGTGNLTLKFLEYGCSVTSVDISENMLKRLERKAAAINRGSLKTAHGDIDSFLESTRDRYHIVCSSSFLHHLPDYLATYRRMTAVCGEDAILYTAFEPTTEARRTFPQRFLTGIDKGVFEFGARRLYNPLIIARAVLRRMKILQAPANVLNQVDHSLIERPGLGVDTGVLSGILRDRGFQSVRTYRRPVTRYRSTYLISKYLLGLDNCQFLFGHRSRAGAAAAALPPR